MADTEKTTQPAASEGATAPAQASPVSKPLRKRKQHPPPLPIRIFPLPTFYPSNPISLFHVAYAWLSQVLYPPALEPAVVHIGIWSPATRSVNITDPKSLRALWEQGFFGKGTYSRSEPNWLRREEIRRGLVNARVSEMNTIQRRQERADTKWERGRAELQALEQKLLEEAGHAVSDPMAAEQDAEVLEQRSELTTHGQPNGHLQESLPLPPVGPFELLALPNSDAGLPKGRPVNGTAEQVPSLPNGSPAAQRHPVDSSPLDARVLGNPVNGTEDVNATPTSEQVNGMTTTNGDVEPMPLKRRKSVRFSPKVESTTFQHSDPPSPNHSASNLAKPPTHDAANGQAASPVQTNGSGLVGLRQDITTSPREEARSPAALDAPARIENKEHLQLSAEEAFFLSFAVGALVVMDADSNLPYTAQELFTLFRRHSYFPPRISGADPSSLSMDDPFLVHYVVYHHFRSMGWVVRHGMKFGVDWLLYQGGPVYSHAAFGIVVVPSYSNPWWKDHDHPDTSKSWHWLSGVNRVLTNVHKTLVLVYVEIPPPAAMSEANGDIAGVLRQFRVREILLKRWTTNRNR